MLEPSVRPFGRDALHLSAMPCLKVVISEEHLVLAVQQVGAAVKCFKAAPQAAAVTFLRTITAPIGPE